MKKHGVYLVLITALVIGCAVDDEVDIPEHVEGLENLTVYPADAQPAEEIRLVEDHVFKDTEEVFFGGISPPVIDRGAASSIVVDETGRVFIRDFRQLTIHVFQHDGTYLKSLGREGEGPGEFESINNLILHNDTLYVYDVGNRSVSIFSLETLEYQDRIFLLPDYDGRIEGMGPSFPISPIDVRNDGTFLARFLQTRGPYFEPEDPDVDAYHHFYVVSEDGNTYEEKIFEQAYPILVPISDNFWLPKPVPFDWMPLFAVSEDDYIFSAETKDFLIKVYDSSGRYRRSFYHPFKRKELTRSEAFAVSDERVHESLRSIDLPEAWPALSFMLIDDEDRLWVSIIVDDEEVYEWWVLEDSGELVGRFTWPRDSQIETIKNGYVYAIERESDAGPQVVVRYRIEMEAASE